MQTEPQDIQGVYECKGKDKDGATYTGAVVIRKVNEVYLLQWAVGATPTGIGIRQDNTLAVSWSTPGQPPGLTLYTIQGRQLKGRWTGMTSGGRIYNETLLFLKALPKEE